MAALQCWCLLHPNATSSLHQPHLIVDQSRGISRKGMMNVLSQSSSSQDFASALLGAGSSYRPTYFPLGGIGRRKVRPQTCLAAAADTPSTPDSSSSIPADYSSGPAEEEESPKSFWQNWQTKSADLREKVSKWGLAAVLAYGLFDGITYTTFFVLAFLSYEKSTGQNPAANLKALLGVVVLMWGGNNVTRPFRVAGAAALAPFIDRGLKKMQKVLKLPNQAFAFMICVATFACACFSVVGILVLSRLGG